MKRRQDILKPIRWPNALVNLTLQWAKYAGLEELMILPHKRSKWSQVRVNKHGASNYYDRTAKQEGFVYDSDRGVYVKRIR